MSKEFKAFLTFTFIMILGIIVFGALAPYLLSMKSDIAVMLGFALMVAYFPVIVLPVKYIINLINQIIIEERGRYTQSEKEKMNRVFKQYNKDYRKDKL